MSTESSEIKKTIEESALEAYSLHRLCIKENYNKNKTLFRDLLSQGVDPVEKNAFGWLPIHAAVYYYNLEAFEDLAKHAITTGQDVGFFAATATLRAGILPFVPNDIFGLSPIAMAKIIYHDPIIPMIEQANIQWQKKWAIPPVNTQQNNFNDEYLSQLKIRLWKAVVGGSLEKLNDLLAEIKIHPQSKEILNYFIPGANNNEGKLVPTISETDKKELEELDNQSQAERRRNVWYGGSDTSLLFVLSVEKLDFAFALLEAGANPFIQNKFGISVFYMIAMFHSDTAERKVAFLRRVKELYPKEFEIDINRNYSEEPYARNNMQELMICQARNTDAHIFIKGWKDLGGKNVYKENHAMWDYAFVSPCLEEIIKIMPEEFTVQKLLTESNEEGAGFVNKTSINLNASKEFFKIFESEGKLNVWRSKGPDFLMGILGQCGINTCKTIEDAQKSALAFKFFIDRDIEILAFPHKSYNIISRIKGQLEGLSPISNETMLRKRYGCELLTLLKNAKAPEQKEANEIFTKSMAEVDMLLAKFTPECQFQPGTVLSGIVPPLIFNQNTNSNAASSVANLTQNQKPPI